MMYHELCMICFPSRHLELCNRVVHELLGIDVFNGFVDVPDTIEPMLPRYLFREQYHRCIEVFEELFYWSGDQFLHSMRAFHELVLYCFLREMADLQRDTPDFIDVYFDEKTKELINKACQEDLIEEPQLDAEWLKSDYLDVNGYMERLFDDYDFLSIDHVINNRRLGNPVLEDLLGIDIDYYFEILPLDIQEEYRKRNKSRHVTLFGEIGELFRYLDDRASNKELHKLFREGGRPVDESRIQLILGALFDAFFYDRRTEIVREASIGNGKVDFLFHRADDPEEKVLIEVKRASSISYLKHGFEKQLVSYLLSSRYRHAFYLIACFTDEEYERIRRFISENIYTEEVQMHVNIRILDLRERPTASAL